MAIMKWSDDLSVQITEIDKQHQHLIDLINKLHEAMLQKQGKQIVNQIIDELAAYTVYHFQNEEKYMQQFKYSGLLVHTHEHETFVKRVDSFQKDYEAGKLGLSIEIMTFLRDWVKNHILVTDKKYMPTFRENGLN
ncbi:MAG: hemerythrin [Methanomicrobiales archaeon HGW-Methanomicrobiales-4]|nr:MAG: hemerythrin [Methanomicrobiales archaeon HGW-Methanomicrobiales-4]